MGVTQHITGTSNVQQLANLLLLRGNIGKPGAGICPLRGHSNVQGDRTVGIWEKPPIAMLEGIKRTFGFDPPTEHGHDSVAAMEAMLDGRSKVFIGLGGNLAVALSDPERCAKAMAEGLDTPDLARRLQQRKQQLLGEMQAGRLCPPPHKTINPPSRSQGLDDRGRHHPARPFLDGVAAAARNPIHYHGLCSEPVSE